MTTPEQKPTVGRIVHVREWEQPPDSASVAAIITAVHSDTCVSLHVFHPFRAHEPRTSRIFTPDGSNAAGWWWPPRV